MKIKHLLIKAEALFNAKKRKRKEQKECLKHVIKKLRKQEKSLLERLKTESDKPTVAKLKQQIDLAHAHRKKGLKVLKALKKS